jgi:hypothetical protein
VDIRRFQKTCGTCLPSMASSSIVLHCKYRSPRLLQPIQFCQVAARLVWIFSSGL